MDMQVGRYQKGERQVIGDRVVLNPRTRLCSLRDAEGNVFDTFRLSLEVCGCGYSFARAGVGYRGSGGWYCKRCGQLHTLDGKQSASDPACLKPDPSRVREFDVGIRVSPDWSTPSDLEAGAGQQRKGGVNARQGTGSKGQGTRGQGGRIHAAAQAADDSGRGRGAAAPSAVPRAEHGAEVQTLTRGAACSLIPIPTRKGRLHPGTALLLCPQAGAIQNQDTRRS